MPVISRLTPKCFQFFQVRIKHNKRLSNYCFSLDVLREYLSQEESIAFIKDKIIELRNEIVFFQNEKADWGKRVVPSLNSNEDFLSEICYEAINNEISLRQKAIRSLEFKLDVLYGKKKQAAMIDIERIKDIPIADLLPAQPQQRAINRLYYKAPWRDEKQASLVVYVDKNRWWDYGEQIGGSNIDLFMKLNDCDFKTAIKELSTY